MRLRHNDDARNGARLITQLQPGEFGKLHLDPATLCALYSLPSAAPLVGMKPGEYVTFFNNPDYRNVHRGGNWGYEHVIVTCVARGRAIRPSIT